MIIFKKEQGAGFMRRLGMVGQESNQVWFCEEHKHYGDKYKTERFSKAKKEIPILKTIETDPPIPKT
tara:strand:- start:256 stop:456 length:201 start_codon:yes stop_codon:yes gene_type:complete